MRLFVVTSNLPSTGHSVRAATVLVREALLAVRELGHDPLFQPLLPSDAHGVSADEERAALEWARAEGLTLLPTLTAPPEPFANRGRLARQAASSSPGLFYPAYTLRDEVARRVDETGADAVFHLWSGPALAACSTTDRPVFAYYGNPDHKPFAARLKHPEVFGIPHATLRNRARLALTRAANRGRQRAHLRLMRRARWAANVCAVDADYYARQGHPDAFYVQNMWTATPNGEQGDPSGREAKIAGSLGGLYGTGNSFGLWFLAREIVPALARRLGDRFSVHVYGAGEPPAPVAEALRHPAIRVRGFVDDIDGELRSSHVFLLANNNNPDFVVGHTRVLHAWSLGMCMVAHRNTARAMPEIVHGENALLGETADEMADLAVQAVEDEELRRRIGAGGRATLEREFTPAVVMRRVLERIAPG